MEKLFRIGDISRLYGIGTDSLRYYERQGVIHPKRSDSGYRLYSVQDIWRLNVIRELLSLGFGLEDIKAYLDHHTLAATLSLLEQEHTAIEAQIARLQALQKNVEQRRDTLLEAQKLPVETITLRELPVRHCFTTAQGYEEEHEMDVLIQKLLNRDKQRFYVIGNNQIGTVIRPGSAQLSYDSVFIIDEAGPTEIPGGSYLTVCYRGAYAQSLAWSRRLAEEARHRGLVQAGPVLEILWSDVHSTSRVEEQVTELQLRVEPSKT